MPSALFVRLALLASAAAPVSAQAQQAPSPTTVAPVATAWENQGSDIPVDPAWRLGTLPNGVRYAVRRSSQPAGAISIRVRMGVGGLMESDAEQGWSHLLEHMVFRGTAHYADGEGIKLWQRLGASFGSDTNAQTTLTATTFQLDLPHADAAGYAQAMAVLAEMMDSARIDPALLATERKVVEAELQQRLSPLLRQIRDAQQPLFFAGTKAAVRDVLGTPATLANADAPDLKAYYERWYRPDNAVVVVAGDADPAMLEAQVKRAFGGWTGTGPTPPAPDWGAPATPDPSAATITAAQAPDALVLSHVQPHPDGPFTTARQQQQYAELVAVGILNQRLAETARRNEAIVAAGAQWSAQRHIEDQLLVTVGAKSAQWQPALLQVYGVLNGVLARPPAQAEIDQQVAAIGTFLQQEVASAETQTAPALADGFITDVENGDVTGAPDYYRQLFASGRTALTPEAIEATFKRLLAPAPRLFVMGPQPVAGGVAAVTAALTTAGKVTGGTAAELRAVSLDQLALSGRPATVAATTPIAALGADRIRFGNGVELVFKRTAFEKDRVRVQVEVGQGLLGEPRDQPGLWWTASALAAAGIGPFSAEELGRVTAGHQYGFGIGAGLDGLVLGGATNGDDLPGMLKLMTGAIEQPRFDANTVDRLRGSVLANYKTIFSQPVSVLQAFGGAALHGGDTRFDALPPTAAIDALTLPAFQRFWTERLRQGPVRVTIVGDVDRAGATAAVAATLGTLAPRASAAQRNDAVRATMPSSPVVLHHQGNADQALVARAWPTLGDLDDRKASAALDLAASIVQTGLTEGFRATQGGSYTPIAQHAQAVALPHYGVFLAGAQVQASRTDAFAKALGELTARLATAGPDADAFARAKATAISATEREREDNGWWLAALDEDLSPARVAELAGREADLKAVTPAAVQAAAARYLDPKGGFAIDVVPQ